MYCRKTEISIFALLSFIIYTSYHAAIFVTATESKNCHDSNDNCSSWAAAGECAKNPSFMHANCAVSCGTCVDMTEEDLMLIEAGAKYGKKQVVQGQYALKTLKVIQKTIKYMQSSELTKQSPEVISKCTNNEEQCAYWAAIGECTNNPQFMSEECGPSCQNCGVPIVPSCPAPGTIPAVHPGGIYTMFERIVANAPGNNTDMKVEEGMTNYTVHIQSMPEEMRGVIDPQLEMRQYPWIVSFDNFLTDQECDALIELGYKVGYTRSHDAGEVRADGSYESIESGGRTSSGAFCSYPANCRSADVPQLVHERIAKVTGVPAGNSEDLQILKYEKGQHYGLHHDFVDQQLVHQCGPRLLTFFLYLSDVEEGGETTFPYLGIAVKPKKGSALLWPNVLSSDPKQRDMKMAHEARAVLGGRKYAANAWLHMYEYIDLPCGISPPHD